ncbi:prepilin peptidase [Paraburkholderia sp. SIMBA_054]|uniref:A24 family peptidase n=1 Tax=Paraburkholderia sp. SIMBA_054 TaxID=3085795 RepID=UPI00397A0C6D
MILPPLPPHPVPLCTVLLVVIAASTDITCRRIPNRIIAIGLAAALLVQGWLHGPLTGGLVWLMGAACGFALLLPFYLMRGMAAGDVKLLMLIGAWVGPEMTFYIALATFLAGGIWSIGIVLYRRRTRQMLANLAHLTGAWQDSTREPASIDRMPVESVGALPYGVAIAAGTLGVLFASAA